MIWIMLSKEAAECIVNQRDNYYECEGKLAPTSQMELLMHDPRAGSKHVETQLQIKAGSAVTMCEIVM